MSGPWYEEMSPSLKYVLDDITDYFTSNGGSKTFIIHKCVEKEYGQYQSFGSYRGYSTFSRPGIIKNVIMHNIALKKIKQNPNVSNWINHILYRPPSNVNKPGLRYHMLEKQFYNGI